MCANIFFTAYLKPDRPLREDELETKRGCQEILRRVEAGEEVAMHTPHLSYVTELIDAGLGHQQSVDFLRHILGLQNIRFYPVPADIYRDAVPISEGTGIDINNAMVYLLMKREQVNEVYTMDPHFDKLNDVKRIIT